mmetsp:Transcript_5048/g.11122  ORF Transcript_5048/g.11122 Transcript_5048/m.11122 type:complete len:239 (-) Transcript_5048:293-1009(-)
MDVAGIGKVHAVTSIQLNVDIPRRQNLILTIHHASNAKRLSADGIVSFFFVVAVVVGREYHGNDRPGRQIHRQTATRGGERPVPRKYPRVYEAEEVASIIIDDVVARMGPFEMFSRASRFRIDVRVFLLLFLFFFFFFHFHSDTIAISSLCSFPIMIAIDIIYHGDIRRRRESRDVVGIVAVFDLDVATAATRDRQRIERVIELWDRRSGSLAEISDIGDGREECSAGPSHGGVGEMR